MQTKSKTSYLCAFLILVPSLAGADTWLETGFRAAGRDLAYVVSAPTRIDVSSALRLGGLALLGTGLVYTLDGEYGSSSAPRGVAARRDVPGALQGPGILYDRIGTTRFVAAGTGLMAAAGLATGNDRLVVTAGRMLEAVAITKGVTALSKRMIGRARPFVDEGPRRFEPLDPDNPRELRSMPSGHTSSAFALATVIANRHPEPWIGVGAYAFATSVALQRVDSRSHWISDTVIGGVLGYVVGRAVLRGDRDESGLTITPGLGSDRISGVVAYAF